MTIAEKTDYLLKTKKQIKNAISQKGVSIADTDSFRSYADKIRQIEVGGGTTTPSVEDWQPEADWWDIETILENDTEDYTQKAIFLLTDELDDSMTNFTISGFEKYKLSDGQEFETTQALDITNIFDVTKDKICSKGYKTRYVIAYTNSSNSILIKVPMNCISLIFDNIKFKYSGSWSDSTFYNHHYLQSVIFKKNTIYDQNNFTDLFYGCHALQNIKGLITEHGKIFDEMLNGCHSLKKAPVINPTGGTSFNYLLYNCFSLTDIEEIDFDKVQGNCNQAFYNCYLLKKIPKLDFSRITTYNTLFSSCKSLVDIETIVGNIGTTIMLNQCNYLSHSTLLKILKALIDLTGQTTKTLTLGSSNLAKLTNEEKVMATEKNWTLA